MRFLQNTVINFTILSLYFIKTSLNIKQIPSRQIVRVNIIIYRFMPLIRPCYLTNFISIFFRYILTSTRPKSGCFYKNINSLIAEKIDISGNPCIVIYTIGYSCGYMMFIISNIASVATSLRLYSIRRTLFTTIIRRFPWILSTFESIFLCIFFCCIKKFISVSF